MRFAAFAACLAATALAVKMDLTSEEIHRLSQTDDDEMVGTLHPVLAEIDDDEGVILGQTYEGDDDYMVTRYHAQLDNVSDEDEFAELELDDEMEEPELAQTANQVGQYRAQVREGAAARRVERAPEVDDVKGQAARRARA